MAETTSAHPLPSLVEVHEEWKQYLLYNRIHRDAFTFTEFLTQKFTADEIEEILNEPPSSEEWKQFVLCKRIPPDVMAFSRFLNQQFTPDEIEEMRSGSPMDVVVADSEQEAKTVNSDDGVRGEECQ